MLTRSGSLFAAVVVCALGQGSAVAQATSCEDLRTRIEAKIRGNGVTAFAVEIVDAEAKAPGKVVGTCALGSKQLVYVAGARASDPRPTATTAANPASSASGNKPNTAAVITECADGRVITTGSCKK